MLQFDGCRGALSGFKPVCVHAEGRCGSSGPCEVGAALKIAFIQFVRLNVNILGTDAGRQHSAIKHQLTRFSYRWTDWNIDPVQFDRLLKIIILISCKLIPQVQAVVFSFFFFFPCLTL